MVLGQTGIKHKCKFHLDSGSKDAAMEQRYQHLWDLTKNLQDELRSYKASTESRRPFSKTAP